MRLTLGLAVVPSTLTPRGRELQRRDLRLRGAGHGFHADTSHFTKHLEA
jgi:hypothetical protein